MTREEIEQTTWDYLRSQGLPELSCAAVMGNIEAESEFDPNLIEEGNGIGLGLCQWSFERRTQLEAYGTDLHHQFRFLWAELSGDLGDTGANFQWGNKSNYLNHDQFMSGQGSLNELTSAFCFCWERPNVALAHLARRQDSANTYYNKFTGRQTTDPPIDPPTDPATPGDVKLKNRYLYGATDSLFGRKFISKNNTFVVSKVIGDICIIKDGNITRKVPKNNIINQ
ncbi:phage tail tip lysozyme [Clostridium beijerinckii]|uniref:phage tail tip lysozyme n=1 Tax=Clostridium beijerinckii TaxID=1520 RepID=UPI0009D52506